MYLQANPSKARSDEEKEELKRMYTVGERVMPKVEKGRRNTADEEDRRMVEEVREMSLREVGVQSPESHEGGTRHRNRDASRDSRNDEARRQRRREERRRRVESQGIRGGGRDESSGSVASRSQAIQSEHQAGSQARQIEHQASLRSLLSNPCAGSSELEEEIMRQIAEEGLLEGIDFDSLDTVQQDELSERIANAYRRRHGRRSRSEDPRSESSRGSSTRTGRLGAEQPHRRQHGRSPGVADRSTPQSHPPVSRPHLLEALPASHERRRRRSSDHRRQTSPVLSSTSTRASSEVRRQAARSATDLSERTSTTERTRPTTLPTQGRRTTDPDSHRSRNRSRGSLPQSPRPGEDMAAAGTSGGPTRHFSMPQATTHHESPIQTPTLELPDEPTRAGGAQVQGTSHSVDTPRSVSRRSSSSRISVQPMLHPEPSIKCNRCDKPHLEYELHQNCSSCLEGDYNLCIRCYRLGLGCLYWYGFGNAALQRYEHRAPPGGYPPRNPLPHVLTGHRYLRPALESRQLASPENTQQTSVDPAKRVQSGAFCSNCSAFANECFWKCDLCNEGEWGFCNTCVNQGKCCSHPLLPLAHALSKTTPHSSSTIQHGESAFDPTARSDASSQNSKISFPSGPFKPLIFSIKCDICNYPISSSSTRFHCTQCNAGDSNICTTCYNRLVSTGCISADDGHKGWRRCLAGHRMIIVGFQDSPLGQRRVVVNELVGGHALEDGNAETSSSEHHPSVTEEEWTWRDGQHKQVRTIKKRHLHSRNGNPSLGADPSSSSASLHLQPQPQQRQARYFPPDGGIGMKLLAHWSYWPGEGQENELTFPKGAVVSEAVDINGDWFWGIYAGAKGLFPGNYGSVFEVVGQ
ncbi:hypothetical protein MMC07_002811 [Pseudocyphellaria aurata]|nr:hypothetical protein [Pseudocyphellaria aurata]